MNLMVEQLSDGALVLVSQDSDINLDLVFSYGAMDEADPMMATQRAYLERIVAACNKPETEE